MARTEQQYMVCGTKSGGCGHVGLSHTWTPNGDMRMCPQCFQDYAFAVDLGNVDRLKEFGMDPEPVREMLEKERDAAEADDLMTNATDDDEALFHLVHRDNPEDLPRRLLPGEPGFIDQLREHMDQHHDQLYDHEVGLERD